MLILEPAVSNGGWWGATTTNKFLSTPQPAHLLPGSCQHQGSIKGKSLYLAFNLWEAVPQPQHLGFYRLEHRL